MESIQDIMFYCAAIPVAYFTALLGGSLIQHFGSQKIISEEELETIAREEASKLGVDDYNLINNWIGKDDFG